MSQCLTTKIAHIIVANLGNSLLSPAIVTSMRKMLLVIRRVQN